MHDARVSLRARRCGERLAGAPGGFDAIMLDMDNGAESFTTGSNRAAVRREGIRTAIAALRPGGRLAYWSVDSGAGVREGAQARGPVGERPPRALARDVGRIQPRDRRCGRGC